MIGKWPAASYRRRGRLYLVVGAGAFAVLTSSALLFRTRPVPYTPGHAATASEEITRNLQRSVPPDVPEVRFVDVAEEAGIRFRHFHGRRSIQLPEDMGSGVAWGDYDNDGDPDLFFVNESGPLTDEEEAVAASPARSTLYRNEGDGTFTDVTDDAGLVIRGCGMGAAWGDYDGDGDLDLVVTRFGTNRLYRNEGDGTFTDASGTMSLGSAEGFWTGASWADYDRDGDLDLYIAGYVKYRYDDAIAGRSSLQYQAAVPFTLNPSTYSPERNLLLRNDGGRFRDVARAAGVDNATGRSLSAAWADFDSDGWPDLYVANDISDNVMFRNQGDGTFQDVSHSAWVADYRGAMGLAIGDWENDGDFDVFVTHWIAQENALFENQMGNIAAGHSDPLHFIDQADLNGLGQIALDFVGWGTGFLDYDNDGRLDLFVANGSTFQREDDPSRLVPMRHQLFWNGGRDRGFFEVGSVSGKAFATEDVGRGAAFADFDGDGDLDIAVAVNGGPARLLRNDGAHGGAWLRVVLRGGAIRPKPGGRGRHATTSFAEGALVRIVTGSNEQIREVGSGPSYLSQSPPGEVIFGVGESRSIDRLEIRWPSGNRQSFRDLPTRATVTIVEGGEPSVSGEGARAETSKAPVIRFWSVYREGTRSRMRGDCESAARSYEEALSIDPTHEDSLYYLGQCLKVNGRPKRAYAAFVRLVAVDPESSRAHMALASLLASTDVPELLDLAAAEDHVRRAHAINAEETGPMIRLGEILIVRGKLAQARAWLEAAARTNPKSVQAAYLAGYVRWMAGEPEASREYYNQAIRASKRESPIQGVLGEGDRKPDPSDSGPRLLRSPLEAAIGETLLGAFSSHLERVGSGPNPVDDSPLDLTAIYGPVRDFVEGRARREPGF